MKKQLLVITATAISGYFLCSQAMAQSIDLTKEIKNFDKVSLNSAGELILKQGSKDSVTVEADPALLPDLNVYQSGHTLNLGLKESDYRARSLKFYVTMKNISAIGDRNSGAVNVASDIKTKDLTLSLQNSGNIRTKNITVDGKTSIKLANSGTISLGQLKTKKINLSLANSGTLNIDSVFANSLTSSLRNSGTISISGGAVNHLDAGVYSSGTYNAADLKSKIAKINIANSGSIYASVSNEISVDISGSGDLYLYGKPKFNSITTTGSGHIHTM